MLNQIETEAEAYFAIMYACTLTDGQVTDNETDELVRTLVKEKLFEEVDVVELYNKIQLINQANRFDAFKLITLAAPKVSDSLKPAVYQTAEHLLHLNGMHTTENKILLHLKTCFWQ